jgi:hypothetical protein
MRDARPSATMTEQQHQEALDAMTLEDVWAVVTKAWTSRRRHPGTWDFIANNVHFVRELDRRGTLDRLDPKDGA